MPECLGRGRIRMSLIVLSLAACGSGGGPRSPKPTDAPAPVSPVPTPTPGPKPVPVPVPTTTKPWDCSQVTLTRAWELGSFADQEMNLLAPMPGGDMIVVGDTYGEVDFGDGVVAQSLDGDDLVVARIRPDGVASWARVISGGAFTPEALAVDASGNIAVGGRFTSFLLFEPGTPGSVRITGDRTLSGFVAVLTGSGDLDWARTIQHEIATESVDALAFDAVGGLWLSGSFNGTDATISFGEADAVAITGGDSDPNDDDAWLAHYDANGALLGVAYVVGEEDQEGLHVAARPAGGVDWGVFHMGTGESVVDIPRGQQPVPTPGTYALVRFDGSGAQTDSLGLPGTILGLGYQATDLLLLTQYVSLPATFPSWEASPPLDLVPGVDGDHFEGLVRWAGGAGGVTSELVSWSLLTNHLFASNLGRAISGQLAGDWVLLPESWKLELEDEGEYSDGDARPMAIAWDPSGAWACAVDIEYTGDSATASRAPKAIALDEAGGLWIAGEFNADVFTFESYPGGPPAAILEATKGEETQGYLARWQLWPGPASGTTTGTP